MFSIHAPAKVNLFLHVGAPLPHGLHPIASLNVFASFGDTLFYKKAPSWQTTGIPEHRVHPQQNSLHIIRNLFLKNYYTPKGHLHVKKSLPIGAGLGGGTSNAAAWLRLLQHIYNLSLPPAFLSLCSQHIGSDFPSCFSSIPHTVSGTGHIISPLSPQISRNLASMGLLIASPKKNLSTKHVFKIFDRLSLTPQNQPSIPPIPQTKKKLLSWLHSQCRNDLTFAATRMAPIVQILLKQMQQIPLARVVRMSGSGSSCFALFDKPVDASKAIPLLLKDPFIKRHVLLTSCRILTLPPTPQTPKSNARSQNL